MRIHGDLESYLKNYSYNDEELNKNGFYQKYRRTIKEDTMSEKKGGAKIFIWLMVFLIVAGVGWFGLTRYNLAKTQAQLESGEAIIATTVIGKVEVLKAGVTDWRILRVNDTLEMGDQVKTAENAYCELQLVSRGVFRLEAQSQIDLALLDADEAGNVNIRLGLDSGEIAMNPEKLNEVETFEVETSTAVAAVRGTKFSVKVDDSGDTRVAVSEGRVAVTPNIKSIDTLVAEGQVSAGAADTLKESVVSEIMVEPGKEMDMKQESVNTLDEAISAAVKDVVEETGKPISEETIAAQTESETEETSTPVVDVVSEVRTRTVRSVATTMGIELSEEEEESVTAVISTVQDLSDEAKQVLANVEDDNKVIQNVVDMVTVNITTAPAGAAVIIDGEEVGTTPYSQIMKKGKEFELVLSSEGYEDYSDSYEITASGRMNINARLTAIVVESEEVSAENETEEAVEELVEEVGATSTTLAEASTTTVPRIMPGTLQSSSAVSFLSDSEINDPVFYLGKIIATSGTTLYILDASSGSLKTVNVPASGSITKPEVGNGYVYVGSESGGLWCYDTSGSQIWSASSAGKETFGAISPSASDGMVAVGSSDKGVQIYDGYGGSLITTISESEQIFSRPVILNDGAIVVYGTQLGSVVGYDLNSKTELWRMNPVSKVLYPMVGNDSAVVVMDRSTGNVYGLDPNTGEEVWNQTYSGLIKTGYNPVYSSGKVAFVSKDGTYLYELQVSTGTLLVLKNYGNISSSPYMDGRWVYVGTEDGTIRAFNYVTEETWESDSIGTSLSAVGADDDGVYAANSSKVASFTD